MKYLKTIIIFVSVILSGAQCSELNQEVNMIKYSDLPNVAGDSDAWTAAALDDTDETSENGTGLQADILNDVWGFEQAVAKSVGETPSGSVETADDSQIYSGLLNNMGRFNNLLFNPMFRQNRDGRNLSGGVGTFRFSDGWTLIADAGVTIIDVAYTDYGLRIVGSGNSNDTVVINQERTNFKEPSIVPNYASDPNAAVQRIMGIARVSAGSGDAVDVKVGILPPTNIWNDYFSSIGGNPLQETTVSTSDVGIIKTAYTQFECTNRETPLNFHDFITGPNFRVTLLASGTFSILIHTTGMFQGWFDPNVTKNISLPTNELRDEATSIDQYTTSGAKDFDITTGAFDGVAIGNTGGNAGQRIIADINIPWGYNTPSGSIPTADLTVSITSTEVYWGGTTYTDSNLISVTLLRAPSQALQSGIPVRVVLDRTAGSGSFDYTIATRIKGTIEYTP